MDLSNLPQIKIVSLIPDIILVDFPKITDLAAAGAAVLSAFFSIGAVAVAWRSKQIAQNALSVARQELNLKKDNLSLYLVDGFKFLPKGENNPILLFNVMVSNQSVISNSIQRLELIVSFIRNDSSLGSIALPHNEELISFLPDKALSPFNIPMSIAEKRSYSQWCVFEFHKNTFAGLRIDKYTIRITDSSNNLSAVSAHLLKEVADVQ